MLLFEPLKIGRVELKNRICMPALHLSYTPDGFVNDRLIGFYDARARGGAAMITVGGCAIDSYGPGPMMVGLDDDKYIGGLQKLTAAIGRHGAKSAAQLYQAGRYAYSALTGRQPVAPSAVPSRLNKETPREMTPADIEEVIEAFGAAALRARQANFDAVEIIASAGYLICQFLSPVTNKRNDAYGGSFEKRARFGIEIVEQVRSKVGSDYTVLVRLSGHDFIPGGSGAAEAALFAAALEKAGTDCFNVTGGWHESRVPQITGELPRGGFCYLARNVKEAVGKPVIASNRINDPVLAESILREKAADLINMGRPLLTDPELPNKAKSGKLNSIRRCIACNQGCLDMVFSLQDVRCTINPSAGRELDSAIETAQEKKKILVIGGGPAGMETALTAAKRGHKVSIWEKGPRLGGHLAYAAMPPGKQDFTTLLDYYEHELAYHGVEIALNREVEAEEAASASADAVVVATGAGPADPPFAIHAPEKVAGALKALDGSAACGRKVVVIGGGSVGCETALCLAMRGTLSAEMLKFLFLHDAESAENLHRLLVKGTHEVTIVEMEKGIGRDIGISTRWGVLKAIQQHGVKVIDQCRVIEVNSAGVLLEKDGDKMTIEADSVILATGAKAEQGLYSELEGKVSFLHLIGDAKSPRKLTEAIEEGFQLGRSL